MYRARLHHSGKNRSRPVGSKAHPARRQSPGVHAASRQHRHTAGRRHRARVGRSATLRLEAHRLTRECLSRETKQRGVRADAWGELLNEISRDFWGSELARLAFQRAGGGAYLEGKTSKRIDQTVSIEPVHNELTASLAVDKA